MNKCILVGNLTKDPELTTTSNGVAVCRFAIAVSRRYANADGERETDFLNIVVWRSLGENCHKFLKKGSKVGVVGNIQSRSYDAQDGSKRYVTEIVAEEVEFLSTKQSDDQPKSASEEVAKLQPIDDDGLPF
jgi:single-strand DNA-binding protein